MGDYFHEACNTFKASNWTLFCARWFGKKIVGRDGNITVTMYRWRGVSYMLGSDTGAAP